MYRLVYKVVFLHNILALIGVSLSEQILNARLNISRKLNVLCTILDGNAWLLPECSVSNCSGEGSSLTPTVPYFLFVTVPTDRSSMADFLQTVQNYTCWVGDPASGKGRA